LGLDFIPARIQRHPEDAFSGVFVSFLQQAFGLPTLDTIGPQLLDQLDSKASEIYFRKISPSTTFELLRVLVIGGHVLPSSLDSGLLWSAPAKRRGQIEL